MKDTIRIIANGGNGLSLPDHTMEAFLAGFSSGCDGLYVVVQQSQDKKLLLSRENDLSVFTDGKGLITNTDSDVIERCDAAAFFLKEKKFPWKRNDQKNYLIQIPELEELLFCVPNGLNLYVELSNESYQAFGLSFLQKVITTFEKTPVPVFVTFITDNVIVLKALRHQFHCWNVAFKVVKKPELALKEIIENQLVKRILIDERWLEVFFNEFYPTLEVRSVGLSIIGHYKGNENRFEQINQVYAPIEELIMPDYLLFYNAKKKAAFEIIENFEGKTCNTRKWKLGYARINNNESYVYQDNGIHIDIQEGLLYSGGSAVSSFPIRGNFSLQVAFSMTNPHTAGTMEVAIINTYSNRSYSNAKQTERQDDSYDVHSSPPYVCVENDEADGFRVMNNLRSTTYTNRYNRDVGEGGCMNGILRLDRVGPFFTGYYKETADDEWTGCGSIINESLNDLVYIRLGAKHWEKGARPYPANHVVFSHLRIFIH